MLDVKIVSFGHRMGYYKEFMKLVGWYLDECVVWYVRLNLSGHDDRSVPRVDGRVVHYASADGFLEEVSEDDKTLKALRDVVDPLYVMPILRALERWCNRSGLLVILIGCYSGHHRAPASSISLGYHLKKRCDVSAVRVFHLSSLNEHNKLQAFYHEFVNQIDLYQCPYVKVPDTTHCHYGVINKIKETSFAKNDRIVIKAHGWIDVWDGFNNNTHKYPKLWFHTDNFTKRFRSEFKDSLHEMEGAPVRFRILEESSKKFVHAGVLFDEPERRYRALEIVLLAHWCRKAWLPLGAT